MISLAALFVVVGQCLWAVHMNKSETYVEASPEEFVEAPSLLRKLSAIGSIGFAVGSQKVCHRDGYCFGDECSCRESPVNLLLLA
jgi:hypothetical protein